MTLTPFTRPTKAMPRSLRHRTIVQALFVAWYNFARKHEVPKRHPLAMANRLSDHANDNTNQHIGVQQSTCFVPGNV